MKRTARVYTEYRPEKSNDTYTVWVERSEGFLNTELEIAGTYDSFKDAHQRQEELLENFRTFGYKTTSDGSKL